MSVRDRRQELEIWKPIPGYSLHEASNMGRIRRIQSGAKTAKVLSDSYGYSSSEVQAKRYLKVKVHDDDGGYSKKYVHTLVCSAFHGIRPTPRHEVNHKDGVKSNNIADNLEWVTHAENIKHAYSEGLIANKLSVKVRDLSTRTEKIYLSMNACATEFGLSKEGLRRELWRSQTLPLRGQYVFSLLTPRKNKAVERLPTTTDILAKDHVTGKIYIGETYCVLAELTGVNRDTIKARLRQNLTSMVNGYSFQWWYKNVIWKDYSSEEAVISRERYLKRKIHKLPNYGVSVKDNENQSVRVFKTQKEAANALNIPAYKLARLLSARSPALFNGLEIEYLSDSKLITDTSRL